jgi:hypothetical protein
MIIIPEIRFTHTSFWESNFDLKPPTRMLKNNHHITDPKNTPKTKRAIVQSLPLCPSRVNPCPTPKPAKIAVKDKIVNGLANVRKKVEKYTPNKLFPLMDACAVAGLEK